MRRENRIMFGAVIHTRLSSVRCEQQNIWLAPLEIMDPLQECGGEVRSFSFYGRRGGDSPELYSRLHIAAGYSCPWRQGWRLSHQDLGSQLVWDSSDETRQQLHIYDLCSVQEPLCSKTRKHRLLVMWRNTSLDGI